jgi:hypothetical protein
MQKQRLKWLWILLGAGVAVVGISTIVLGFLLYQNEPSINNAPNGSVVNVDPRAADEAFLGVPYPPSASFVQRYGDERGIDKLLIVRFQTSEAEAVAYVQGLTGGPPQPGFSIQDLDVGDMGWWKQRPAKGRGGASNPAVSAIAKRLLLSEVNLEGKTTVWVMANET